MLVTQFDKFVNRSTREILGSEITREDLSPMISTELGRNAVLTDLIATQNGLYVPPGGVDGFRQVLVDIAPDLEELNVNTNGIYIPSGHDGYSKVNVNVPNTYTPGDEGKVVDNGALVSQTPRPSDITQNGVYDTTKNNSVNVNVPNTYTPGDEGKVVNNGELVSQTSRPNDIIQNGTYDTTLYDSITVNVSGLPIPQSLKDFAIYINKNISMTYNPNNGLITVAPLEYQNNIYNNPIIQSLNMVLLGDFSQGGLSTGNELLDDITNYSTIVLQGIYQQNRTSSYNTSMAYVNIVMNTAYWAGMKDKNNDYTCNVTFTNATHCNLSGNKQVIIYGIV